MNNATGSCDPISPTPKNFTFKTRFRFTEQFDLHLAREAYAQNPYEDPKRWQNIQVSMIQITGKSLSIRTLRERMQNLVKKIVGKEKANEGRSGIEIVVTEIDELLQKIAEVIAEFSNKKKNIVNSEIKSEIKSSYLKGFETREMAAASASENTENCIQTETEKEPLLYFDDMPQLAEKIHNPEKEQQDEQIETTQNEPGMKPSSAKKRPFAQRNILTPVRRRATTNVKQTTIHYLTQKNEKNYLIRCRELALQERQQILAEEKFKLEVKEREKRLEIEERRAKLEEERFKTELDIFKNQQELIKMILNKEMS